MAKSHFEMLFFSFVFSFFSCAAAQVATVLSQFRLRLVENGKEPLEINRNLNIYFSLVKKKKKKKRRKGVEGRIYYWEKFSVSSAAVANFGENRWQWSFGRHGNWRSARQNSLVSQVPRICGNNHAEKRTWSPFMSRGSHLSICCHHD